ncbi:transcriptional regulator swi6 [Rhizophlyctis rosea]|nr:transcriptional regulator swi6 [Rhizophlyctis rosea]
MPAQIDFAELGIDLPDSPEPEDYKLIPPNLADASSSASNHTASSPSPQPSPPLITSDPVPPCRLACYRNIYVHEFTLRGTNVMRRLKDGWVNVTGMLKAGGFDHKKRDEIINREVMSAEDAFGKRLIEFEKVRLGERGRAHLAVDGTWVPFEDSCALAGRYNLLDQMAPLLGNDNNTSGTSGDPYSDAINNAEVNVTLRHDEGNNDNNQADRDRELASPDADGDGSDEELDGNGIDKDAKLAETEGKFLVSEEARDGSADSAGSKSTEGSTVDSGDSDPSNDPVQAEQGVETKAVSAAYASSRQRRRGQRIPSEEPDEDGSDESADSEDGLNQPQELSKVNGNTATTSPSLRRSPRFKSTADGDAYVPPTFPRPKVNGDVAPAETASTSSSTSSPFTATAKVVPAPSATPAKISKSNGHPFLTITDSEKALDPMAPDFTSFLLAIPNGVAKSQQDAENRTAGCLEKIKRSWDHHDQSHWLNFTASLSRIFPDNALTAPNQSATVTGTRPTMIARLVCSDPTAKSIVALRRAIFSHELKVLHSVVHNALEEKTREVGLVKEEVESLRKKVASMTPVPPKKGQLKHAVDRADKLTEEMEEMRKKYEDREGELEKLQATNAAWEKQLGQMQQGSSVEGGADLEYVDSLEQEVQEAKEGEQKLLGRIKELELELEKRESEVKKPRGYRKKQDDELKRLSDENAALKQQLAARPQVEVETGGRAHGFDTVKELSDMKLKFQASEDKNKALEQKLHTVEQALRDSDTQRRKALESAAGKENENESDESDIEIVGESSGPKRRGGPNATQREAALQAEVLSLLRRMDEEQKKREDAEKNAKRADALTNIMAELLAASDTPISPFDETGKSKNPEERKNFLLTMYRGAVERQDKADEKAAKQQQLEQAAKSAKEEKGKRKRTKATTDQVTSVDDDNIAGPSSDPFELPAATSDIVPAGPAAEPPKKRGRRGRKANDPSSTPLFPAETTAIARTAKKQKRAAKSTSQSQTPAPAPPPPSQPTLEVTTTTTAQDETPIHTPPPEPTTPRKKPTKPRKRPSSKPTATAAAPAPQNDLLNAIFGFAQSAFAAYKSAKDERESSDGDEEDESADEGAAVPVPVVEEKKRKRGAGGGTAEKEKKRVKRKQGSAAANPIEDVMRGLMTKFAA